MKKLGQIKLLEQKFVTDNKNVYYNKFELKQHDKFVKEFIIPLNKEINENKFNPNWIKYFRFLSAYDNLPEKIKKVLEEVYIEYRVLYFKKKIENIIVNETFKQDSFSLNKYILTLNSIIWDKEVNDYLNWLKK